MLVKLTLLVPVSEVGGEGLLDLLLPLTNAQLCPLLLLTLNSSLVVRVVVSQTALLLLLKTNKESP